MPNGIFLLVSFAAYLCPVEVRHANGDGVSHRDRVTIQLFPREEGGAKGREGMFRPYETHRFPLFQYCGLSFIILVPKFDRINLILFTFGKLCNDKKPAGGQYHLTSAPRTELSPHNLLSVELNKTRPPPWNLFVRFESLLHHEGSISISLQSS